MIYVWIQQPVYLFKIINFQYDLEMSYGWMTESALLPEKSKDIKVDNSSFLSLQAVLSKERGKNNRKLKRARDKKRNIFKRKNKGVEDRSKRDLAQKAIQEPTVDSAYLKEKLEAKSSLYQKLMGKKVKHSLVDFQLKQINEETEEDKLRYEQEKQKFYLKQQEKVKSLNTEIVKKKIGSMNAKNDLQEKARLQWEKQTIMDLQAGIDGEMTTLGKRKRLVLQQYERRKTENEKNALQKVIKETITEQTLIEDVKRKRDEIVMLRTEKLKKLKLL